MKTFKEKFKYAIRPYLLICIASTIVADIAYYFLFIENTSNYNELVTNMLIPVCFAALVQLIILLPFINRFVMPPKQNRFGVNFLSFMLLCAPVVISIPLAEKVTAEIVTVNKVSEIIPSDNQYYYSLKNTELNLNRIGESFWTESKSRKNRGSYTELNVVFAAPVNENGTNNLRYWITKSYSQDEKSKSVPTAEFDNFRIRSLDDFNSEKTTKDIVYLEKIPEKWVGNHTLEAINDIMYNSTITNFVVLNPHYKSLADEIQLQVLFLVFAFIVIISLWSLTIWKMELKQDSASGSSTKNWRTRKD